jgi:translation initiation factor 5
MAYLNINNSDDIFYRYKMSPIKTIEQRANRLALLNIDEISKQLNVDTKILVKFISYELGTTCGGSVGKWWITSRQIDVQPIIYKFIDIFILCSQCGNPETSISKKLKRTCASCGYIEKLSRLDDNSSIDKTLKLF